jgi:hypothetical protein
MKMFFFYPAYACATKRGSEITTATSDVPAQLQGCQIFLGTIYQNRKKYTKTGKIYTKTGKI